jgi:hypothetical protein
MSDETHPPQKSLLLSAAQVAEAERRLLANPDDLETRQRLLIQYHHEGLHSKTAIKDLLRHLLWVIECHPGSELAGGPYAFPLSNDDKGAIRNAWLQQVAKQPQSASVLGNAAKFVIFFSPQDRAQAQIWLETAEALEPANPEWPEQLGKLVEYAPAADRGDERTEAQQALRHYEHAYELSTDEMRKGLLLDGLVRTAYRAGEFARSAGYARELLQAAPIFKDGWNYGNALHWSHIYLGKVALIEGDVEAAKIHLKVAGETPGSPQLNSFGPDLSLAQALLEREEREVVLAYLEGCSRFWECGKQQLADWTTALRKNRMPDFSRSCRI